MEDPDRLTPRHLAVRTRCRECGDWIEAGSLALVGRNMTYCLAVQDCANRSWTKREGIGRRSLEDGRGRDC